VNDLKFAIRQLLKNPGFTAVAVLTLALGIGANTTVLSWIDSALLHPVPGARDADGLVAVAGRHASGALSDTVTYPDLQDLGQTKDVFSGVIASQYGSVALGSGESTDWVWGQITTANFFDVLGVKAELGRVFLPDEEVGKAGDSVAVISHGLWLRRFGGDPKAVGHTIEINRQPFTIVGVAPAEFKGTMGGLSFDLWIPLSQRHLAGFGDDDLTRRNDRWLHAMARLQPGVSRRTAQVTADTVMQRLQSEYPNTNQNQGVALFALWASPYGAQAIFLPLLRVLLGVTLLVFLLVVANVASLLLARATARSREMAVRLAVGASRGRLLRQLLTESLLMAALGGSLGVLFARWALGLLFRLMPATYLPIGYDLRLGGLELAATLGLTMAAGILFGLAPAWQAARSDLNTALKEGGRGDSGRAGRHSLRSGLVVTEIAFALVVLVAAGLCIRSLQNAHRTSPGFSTTGVWLSGFRLRAQGYNEERGGRYFQQLRQRLAVTPGVEAAAFADWLPLGFEGGSFGAVGVDGYDPQPGESLSVGLAHVSPDYFRALKIPLLDGRDFTEADDPNAPRRIIVNEAFVKRFLSGRHPLGAKVRYWGSEATIVGVVATGKYRSLAEPPKPFLYDCAWQSPTAGLTAVVKMKGEAGNASALVSREAAALDPAVKVWVGMSLANFAAAAFAIQGIAAQLLFVLGVAALVLAAMGIYGVVAFSVSQRTRELGIRMALGAQRGEVGRLVLRQGLRLALVGTAAGLLGAWAASRLLSNLLIGVGALDPLIFVCVTCCLIGVALLACWLPARRAARIDPMVALRAE
jgi:putative ABC transport system permease protein